MSSRIDFFYYAFRNILLVSLPILAVSALVLSSFRSSAMNGLTLVAFSSTGSQDPKFKHFTVDAGTASA